MPKVTEMQFKTMKRMIVGKEQLSRRFEAYPREKGNAG
jgi:hypothetical protein